MLFSLAPPSLIKDGILGLGYKLLLTMNGGTVCVIATFRQSQSRVAFIWQQFDQLARFSWHVGDQINGVPPLYLFVQNIEI